LKDEPTSDVYGHLGLIMSAATPAAVRKQIASGTTDPVYLLVGEDDEEKSALAAAFAELVDEGLRAFNVERLHAGDWTTGDRLAEGVGAIVAAARTLPMMAPRRVVTIAHAEALLVPKRESDAGARALAELEALVKTPEPQTTLVFVAGPLDKRSRMVKLLTSHATLVLCGLIEDAADAERWVRTRIAASGIEIDPKAARLLAERGGLDLQRLRNDVDRLLLYALGQKRVTVEDVREIVGPAALQDDWAMTNAIEAGHGGEALRQLAFMLDAGAPPEKILGQLGWLVRSKFPIIRPADLSDAVAAVFRTDLDLKQSAGHPRVLLERLVVELCGRGRIGSGLRG
jgi:DNA polymerase-3 subunit delta